MHPFLKTLLVISVLAFFTKLSAQDDSQDYHRFYYSDDELLFNLASFPSADGGFFLANVNVFETQNGVETNVNVTKHNVKGNQEWSQGYTIPNAQYGINFKNLDLSLINEDLYLVGTNLGVTTKSEYFIIKIDQANGDVLWSNVIADEELGISLGASPIAIEGYNDDLNLFTPLVAISNGLPLFGFNHEAYDAENESTKSISYFLIDTLGNPQPHIGTEATTTLDSNFVLSSLVINGNNGDRYSLIKTDTLGELITAAQYGIGSVTNIQALGVTSLPDTSLVTTGLFIDPLTQLVSGFLSKTDSLGNLVWAKVIDGSVLQALTIPNDVLINTAGEIVVSGRAFYLNGELADFTITLDQIGNTLHQRQYISPNTFILFPNDPADPLDDILLASGDLHHMADDALLYSTQGINRERTLLGPMVVKMDQQGESFCNDTISIPIVSDLLMIRDTLNVASDAFAFRDTLMLEEEMFSYDNTVLMLLDTFFCPQDPVDALLEAFVDGATDFIWSTGDTTESIRVFEEGEYTVTVTVGEDVCYMLCDTSTITVREFPEASIGKDFSGVCEEDLIGLFAGSSTQVANAMWSTGESTNTINVTEPGTYSVTITDDCDNTATATVDVDPAEFIIPFDLGINEDVSLLCSDGSISLQATSPDIDLINYLWSTGETSQTIQVSEAGTYSVEMVSICNDTQSTMITIDPAAFDLSFPLELQFNNFNLCADGTLELVPVTSADLVNYMWSTGETTQTITVLPPGGNFSITVTDVCGQVEEASLNIGPEAFELSDPLVQITTIQTCEGRTLIANGSEGVSPYSFEWSTGETTSNISINTPGTYTVTITDACDEMSQSEITIAQVDLENGITVSLETEGNCPPIMVTANVSGFLNELQYEWSPTPTSGAGTSMVSFEDIGTYMVTVTNGCDIEPAVGMATGAPPGDALEWPNLFFPETQRNEVNQTFGPYIECPEFFTEDYKLEIFTRWGDKLYESERIIDRWNGRNDNQGQTVQEDVYMYVWSYGESTGSGHVTLVK